MRTSRRELQLPQRARAEESMSRGGAIPERALTVRPVSSTLRPTPRRPRRRSRTYSMLASPKAMRCTSRETSSRAGIAFRGDAPHLALDPGLDLVVHRDRIAALRGDERTDDH